MTPNSSEAGHRRYRASSPLAAEPHGKSSAKPTPQPQGRSQKKLDVAQAYDDALQQLNQGCRQVALSIETLDRIGVLTPGETPYLIEVIEEARALASQSACEVLNSSEIANYSAAERERAKASAALIG